MRCNYLSMPLNAIKGTASHFLQNRHSIPGMHVQNIYILFTLNHVGGVRYLRVRISGVDHCWHQHGYLVFAVSCFRNWILVYSESDLIEWYRAENVDVISKMFVTLLCGPSCFRHFSGKGWSQQWQGMKPTMARYEANNGKGWSQQWQGMKPKVARDEANNGKGWSQQWQGMKPTMARDEANNGKGWSQQWQGMKPTMARDEANNGKGWSQQWQGMKPTMARYEANNGKGWSQQWQGMKPIRSIHRVESDTNAIFFWGQDTIDKTNTSCTQW